MQNEAASGRGYLRVIVNTAGGALPVPGATVTVYGNDTEGDNTGILYALTTDWDGLTETVELNAPPRALSMEPGNAMPYARYTVLVERTGDGSVRNVGVPVFDGVVSTQTVTLIPLSEYEDSRTEQVNETPAGENPLL